MEMARVLQPSNDERDFVETSRKTKVYIRWMIRRDMPEVLNIINTLSVTHTEEEILEELRQRNCIGMVAEYDDKIVGYMIYILHKKRLELSHFAIRLDYRRQQIGTQMINKIKGKLSGHRRTSVNITVPEDEIVMLNFFKSNGFAAELPILKERFGDRDGYYLVYNLPPETES
jgi:ribosomal-protein-alanine N-acetyltransferase